MIRRLPEELINLIAAGEVVERPCSVLKELAENSLDAHAQRIEVSLKAGGKAEVCILDDGSGIAEAELPLAIERHATSKIGNVNDLEAIATMGFRGEALSSIAAVSRVEIRSRVKTAEHGLQLQVDFGVPVGPATRVGMPVGTRIRVSDLFEKTPARQKFLKSDSTELGHCIRVFKELAIANPQTQFKLLHHDRKLFDAVAKTRLLRFLEIETPEWKPNVVQAEHEDIKLEGLLSPAHFLQAKGDILFVVNQRPIRNRALASAIRSAYSSSLGPNHEPSGVVFLDVDAKRIDPNVHPQKSEIRIHRQEALYPWLVAIIRKSIAESRTVLEIRPKPVAEIRVPDSSWKPVPKEEILKTLQAVEEIRSSIKVSEPIAPVYAKPVQEPLPPSASFRFLGQIKASYLVCEDETGLILVDQHALHEKQAFEKLVEKVEQTGVKRQGLLLPLLMRLSPEENSVFADCAHDLERAGFELEKFGENELIIRSFPEGLPESEVQQTIRETLRATLHSEFVSHASSDLLRKVLATVACHSVVRANQSLTDLECENLLKGIDRLELGWTCPHGRPVLFRLPFAQVQKHFQRT